jgi:hypothetical protein
MRYIFEGIKNVLILRKPPLRDAACGGSSGQSLPQARTWGGCLEGRSALIRLLVNSHKL